MERKEEERGGEGRGRREEDAMKSRREGRGGEGRDGRK